MAATSTGITLSSDFYLSGFYKANRNVRKASGRTELTSTELSYEDSRALSRAVKKLASFDLSEEDNLDNLKNSISAFADTYNNAISSSSKNDASEINKYAKQLKKLATRYSDELEDIGISIKSDGSMKVNSSLLSSSKIDKIKQVFSKENSGFLKETQQIARRLNSNAYDSVYTQMTGNGGRINIIL